MNKINKLIFFLPIFFLGCAPNLINENKVTKEINSLDLNIYSKSGDKKYSITSPYSIYDNIKDKYQFKKTTINIFECSKTKFIINSDESTLLDNNKVLKLKGNVIFKTTKKDEDRLYGDNFVWSIDDNNYLLTGNVKFENKNVILTAGKAKMNSDNIIEFFYPVKYKFKNDNNEDKYEVNSENAYYDIDQESLSFKAKDKKVRSKIYF